MDNSTRYCISCAYWDPSSPTEGRCRRNAPTAISHPHPAENTPAAYWPLTLAQDWCGEWQSREALPVEEESPVDSEDERFLRNTSIAEALLVLPADKRDKLLLEVLTEEERRLPTPPEDFYERVQEYFARQKDAEPQ